MSAAAPIQANGAALVVCSPDHDCVPKAIITVEMAKRLLASLVSLMQDAIRRGEHPSDVRDEVLRDWGLDGETELEYSLRQCSERADEDRFLQSWMSLYREVSSATSGVKQVQSPTSTGVPRTGRLMHSQPQSATEQRAHCAPSKWVSCD
mmetsp:Transcript_47643/g.94713  ORF Transcript_47643/g.94713 Transcript_47643/m.94713 type:complete len:150 (-) Transcript_47643:109-558(-)|eukprot:CAMPEP_0172689042 /NCGR_PEP_ID=MMETSP1074-20121228/22869_1 /TAXON_ID=2916 /ORGANISM="Ceratium fusus, Strain PA161109" /LENGTH=149 /DNA_ID=CAMNT_0013508793 /DNA_START=34 /DNA_END=483 /DNA_ORIENTATION=+